MNACVFTVCFFVLTAIRVIAETSPSYPPSGYQREDKSTDSAGSTFRIEQWVKYGAASNGSQLYQTWLVPAKGPPFKLPEALLSKDPKGDENSGNVGFSSEFFISSDNNYIFRQQKVCRGNNGAYLYKREQGLQYEALFPRITQDASSFFSKQTGLRWYYGDGIVEFSGWKKNGEIVLTLRGVSEDRKYGILGWRCLFSPATGAYSVPEDWMRQNKKCIKND